MSDSTPARLGVSRRSVLRGAAGAGLAAVAGVAGAQEDGPDYGGWFDDVDDYQGTVDFTGQEAVEVTVGADGNGGTFAFEPAAIRVDPGTTVTFTWATNTHNVLIEDSPDGTEWSGHETIEDEGFSFDHAFEAEGTFTYYCEPHLSMGMKGAVVVGGSGGISPEEAGVAGAGQDGGSGGDNGGSGGDNGGESGDSGGAEASGEGGEGGEDFSNTGVYAMVLAGVVAFLSPLLFAVLMLVNRDGEERPAGQREVEYRPGANR